VSRANDDEVPALVEDIASSELLDELASREVALVDGPDGTVLEDALLAANRFDSVASHRRDDNELGGDAPRLGEETRPLLLLEMTVEVAREDAVERAGFERESERISLHEPDVRRLRPRHAKHACTLVEPDDVTAQMAREEAGAAGDVERARGWERGDDLSQHIELVLPARSIALRVQTFAEPPVVVLRCATIVVGLHDS